MKILSFDVESNGLHGPAFAVAGVVLCDTDTTVTSFEARCPLRSPIDDFVTAQVLPQMTTMPQTHATARAMRDDFWQWYVTAKVNSDHVVVQNGYPVEARFLIACQQDDLASRYFAHPFPMLDLTSLLFQIGATTPKLRDEYITSVVAGTVSRVHDPRYDAWVTARTCLQAMRDAGRLSKH